MDGSIETPLFVEKSGEKAEKKGKNHYGEKAEKKAEIFSIFISAFSPYNREYWDSAFYGRKRRKSGYFLHIHFRFFSIKRKWIWRKYGEKAENEYGEIMDLHKILHNILHKKVENEYGEIMDLHNILHKAYWEKYWPANGLELLDLNNPNNQACKFCASFHNHWSIQTVVTVRNAKFGSKLAIFCPVWPWNLIDDLEKQ